MQLGLKRILPMTEYTGMIQNYLNSLEEQAKTNTL